MDISSLTVKELIEKCKEFHITKTSGKKKQDLINLITQHLHTSNVEKQEISPEETIDETIELNNIYLGDCVEYIHKMKDNSVDMICTDPPYFLDGLGNEWNKKKIDDKGSSSVVGNLPKGMKFDRQQSKKFYEFYLEVSKQLYRVLKPGGVFISFSSPRLYHSMTMAVEDAGFEVRDMLGWIYTQSQVKAFSQNHIIDNDKSKTDEQKQQMKDTCKDRRTIQLKPAIEPMCLAMKPVQGRLVDNFIEYGTGLMHISDETKTGSDNDYFPSNILTTEPFDEAFDKVFLVAKPNKKEKGDFNTHLSVKPLQLISHLVRLFTKENAVVLDPFMGSGTTAVACSVENRKYIGFELNKEYIDVANKRLESINE